jgi:hypothetical protein
MPRVADRHLLRLVRHCGLVGIIRALRGKRAVCPLAGTGAVYDVRVGAGILRRRAGGDRVSTTSVTSRSIVLLGLCVDVGASGLVGGAAQADGRGRRHRREAAPGTSLPAGLRGERLSGPIGPSAGTRQRAQSSATARAASTRWSSPAMMDRPGRTRCRRRRDDRARVEAQEEFSPDQHQWASCGVPLQLCSPAPREVDAKPFRPGGPAGRRRAPVASLRGKACRVALPPGFVPWPSRPTGQFGCHGEPSRSWASSDPIRASI